MPIYTSVLSSSVGMTLSGAIEVDGIVMNKANLSKNTPLPAGHNALLYGPITIATDTTVTIGSTANLKIKDISDA